MDIMTSIASSLENRGMRVHAKLTVGERTHRFSMPNDLIRRKANQEELLAWLEHRPTKLPPKVSDELKNIFGKAVDSMQLEVLDRLKEALEGADENEKLKDNAKISAIAPVKDADINVRQFERILKAAFEEKKGRVKALQDILRISNDDLSVKNLKKYLSNTQKEISNKSNFFDISNREIEDELELPRITHEELSLKSVHNIPKELSTMVRQYQELVEEHKSKKLSIEEAINELFKGVKYKIELSHAKPIASAPEIGDLRENMVHVLDSLTGHAWESHYTLVTIRSMKEVVLVGFYANEAEIVRKGLAAYQKALPKSMKVDIDERFFGRGRREDDDHWM